jgi:hypothetical protein
VKYAWWNNEIHSYSFTCCRWAEALIFLAEFVGCLRSVKESSTLSQQVHLTVMAFQLYKLFIVLKCIGIRPNGIETNLESINRCEILFQPRMCIFCLLWRHFSSCRVIEVPYVYFLPSTPYIIFNTTELQIFFFIYIFCWPCISL